MRRLLIALFVFLSAFAVATAARADTIATFDVNLSFETALLAPFGTTSGQVEIDTTNGFVTGQDFSFVPTAPGTPYTFTTGPDYGVDPGNNNDETVTFYSGPPSFPSLTIEFPLQSLIGYTGGNVCSGTNPVCFPCCASLIGPEGEDFLSQGSLAPVLIITGTFDPFGDPSPGVAPEPSSLILFGTGLLGAVAVGGARRRFAVWSRTLHARS
jgi:hypothetical protein